MRPECEGCAGVELVGEGKRGWAAWLAWVDWDLGQGMTSGAPGEKIRL